MQVFPIILAGGSGSRLWPLSGASLPKQFLSLLGSLSPFQATVQRIRDFCPPDRLRVVCGEKHRIQAEKALQALDWVQEQAIIAEPSGRNTAPAMALAGLRLSSPGEDPVLIFLPADHVITRETAFHQCLQRAVNAARADHIIVLGLQPTRPETGYGYIETNPGQVGEAALAVKRFVEKPDAASAQKYLNAGHFYWNAGIFVCRASVLLQEFSRWQPEVLEAVQAYTHGDTGAYDLAPRLSFDHAVMEHTRCARVIPANFGWCDLGDWATVHDLSAKDSQGNAIHGEVVLQHCRNSYFRSEYRPLAGLGLENIVVVESAGGVLVTHRAYSQEVRLAADQLHGDGVTEHRPWGSFTILDEGPDFKTKRLEMLPGKRFSLQRHRYRSEHWIIIRGRAMVTRDKETIEMGPGDATVIPVGMTHRIENPGPETLCLIEVQLGSYFGEDDIVRIEDDFGRKCRTN